MAQAWVAVVEQMAEEVPDDEGNEEDAVVTILLLRTKHVVWVEAVPWSGIIHLHTPGI